MICDFPTTYYPCLKKTHSGKGLDNKKKNSPPYPTLTQPGSFTQVQHDTSPNMQIKDFIEDHHAFIERIEDRLSAFQRTSDPYYLEEMKQLILRKKRATSSFYVESHFGETTEETFLQRLQRSHPDLTSHELRICTLLRLGQSSKSIANNLNIKAASVDVARHRIRKKLGLPPGESLSRFLDRF